MSEAGGCPCLYTDPCHPMCTCRQGHSSRGCLRCCSYGSIEQRTARAKVIADNEARYWRESNRSRKLCAEIRVLHRRLRDANRGAEINAHINYSLTREVSDLRHDNQRLMEQIDFLMKSNG